MGVRVDFYVLEQGAGEHREQTACRIAEKAWQQQLPVFVHTATPEAAARIDTLLWTFKQSSFIPHEILTPQADARVPVWVGQGMRPPAELQGVLINLDENVPDFFSQFERVVELIAADDESRRAGRGRWMRYKEHGCEIQSHNV